MYSTKKIQEVGEMKREKTSEDMYAIEETVWKISSDIAYLARHL